jgi:hypothetical protein
MSEHTWGLIGKASVIVGILAAIVTVLGYFGTLNAPSSLLVADIRPMAFRLPVTHRELTELTKTDKPISQGICYLLEVSRATGLVKIDLHNNGDLPITDIHINVDQAQLYETGSEIGEDYSVLPLSQSGTIIPSLDQGRSMTVYVWTREYPEVYRHWNWIDGISSKFNITYLHGIASKNVYIEGSPFLAWFERNWLILMWVPIGIFCFLFLFLSVVGQMETRS